MLHKKQKALTKTPTSPPAPLPWGEGSMIHKKQKALTKTHKKGFTFTTPQASPPHEMRKGRAALPRGPFAFRGVWGDWSPHKKKELQFL